MLGAGLFGGAPFAVVVGGALALLLGAALLARFVTRPLLRVVGWPLGRLGVRGTLARENAIRSPQRTASTASALMIGLGLVTFALIFGASLRESATAMIDEQFVSDLQVRTTNFETFPAEVDDRVGALPEVARTADMRSGQVGVRGRVGLAAGIEPDELDAAFRLDTLDGSLDDFAEGGLVISGDAAERLDVGAGDTLPVTFATGGEQDLPIRAVIDAGGLDVDYLIDEQTMLANGPDDGVMTLYVTVADGVGSAQARTAIEGVTDDYAALTVQDSTEYADEIGGQVDQILGLISALLGLSVLIALLGAVFGTAVGVVFGWMSVQALAGQGVSTFAFPVGQVALAVLAAAVAGTLAAVLPARRAARVDVLRALAES
jgi:putative ABC transport system permease protein